MLKRVSLVLILYSPLLRNQLYKSDQFYLKSLYAKIAIFWRSMHNSLIINIIIQRKIITSGKWLLVDRLHSIFHFSPKPQYTPRPSTCNVAFFAQVLQHCSQHQKKKQRRHWCIKSLCKITACKVQSICTYTICIYNIF